eukprot:TRINITY_DN65990_c0_g1_i1.p1 TRINITY_DN65990_c0_g1~~TRINITY_DN65990_c0_g1_i1.p1  ORF type:complete len:142 (+),score=9.02 TRINITY_DN65990_c0_g1_i1:180-605(+)
MRCYSFLNNTNAKHSNLYKITRVCNQLNGSQLTKRTYAKGRAYQHNVCAKTEQQITETKINALVKEREEQEVDIKSHSWMYKDQYKIRYSTAGCGEPVLLIHGFGASIGHYRKIFTELSKDHKVYALDLLGFGASDKPTVG